MGFVKKLTRAVVKSPFDAVAGAIEGIEKGVTEVGDALFGESSPQERKGPKKD